MTDPASVAAEPAGIAAPAARRMKPIVPAGSVAGNALMLVIAIMTFLSCLTFGAVTLVRDTASMWQSQISREATIQVKPADDLDMEAALLTVQSIATGFPGVREARIVDRQATARLLSPWLGDGVSLDELPVPRLVIVTLVDTSSPPDFVAMRAALSAEVASATLDDHRTWIDRLVAMARTTVAIGIATLGLILGATVLTVIFATRGAMAGNGQIIEVLHFVGAESSFIAREFRHHFLMTGAKGAAAGGVVASVVFLAFGWWSSSNMATPQADQATALFGNFAIGASGYLGVVGVVALVAILTAATSHITVVSYLHDIDMPGRSDI